MTLELVNRLPIGLQWNVMQFMSHPVADLVQERLKAHSVSLDRQKPFHRFHFANREYDYYFLKAEYESEMYYSG